jgi:LacI family transcriptional regulator
MATIYDVARAAGVSPTTVSHVLNQTRYVSDDTKLRVQQAVALLRYRPNSLARGLVRQETRTIALIVADNVNPFFAELARSIEDYGFAAGYNVILCNSDRSETKELAYLDMLISKRVDGIIYTTMSTHLDQLEPLLENKIPLALFEREYEEIDAVLLDNMRGGYEATRYLIELGHQRIGCICGPDAKTRSHARIKGYEQALREAGIDVDPDLIQAGAWTPESGQAGARQLFELSSPPTAIFACNDLMAIGALTFLRSQNIRVPEDVSVIGFDNVSLGHFSCPPLTTLATPIGEVGQRLCELLLGRISGQLPPVPQRLIMPSEVVVRASTARLSPS